jgi:HlyD family secretion protein
MLFRITKRRVFWALACVAFVVSVPTGYAKLRNMSRVSAADRFRTASIHLGSVKYEVKCTGTVQPVLSVQVGSYVSGPIKNVYVDFNDNVKKDQLMAEIDPQVYKAQRRQAKAALDHSLADLEQFKAKLNQTERDYKRAKELYKITDIPGTGRPIKGIADSDFDLARANFEMATANVDVAKASVEQNQAMLEAAETNLGYTSILSPVDGIVIDRKVDAGQTLASQFQTPVMFVVAPDLEKKIWVLASVDEADIGLIRKAKENGQPVHFTVDAYQDEKFKGKILQVRLGPKAAQPGVPVNVVTYTAVVEAPNSELKLLPGMTANLVFQIEKHENVLKIPNAAMRFHPKPEDVHPQHLALLEGLKSENEDEGEEAATKTVKKDADANDDPPADSKAESDGHENKKDDVAKDEDTKTEGAKADSKKTENKKYVWILEGELLSPVEVKVGINDSHSTEMLSGELKQDQKVVTGLRTAAEIVSAKKAK